MKPSLEGMKAGFCEEPKERGACFTHLSFEREEKERCESTLLCRGASRDRESNSMYKIETGRLQK